MSDSYLHLIVNHFPIFSMFFGLLILGWGYLKKNEAIKKIAFYLFILGSVTSYIAVETGEGAEYLVEDHVTSVSHDLIHEHEEAAEISLWFSTIAGFLALTALIAGRYNTRFNNMLAGVIFITATVAMASLIYTAYEGGKIRHLEARSAIEQGKVIED